MHVEFKGSYKELADELQKRGFDEDLIRQIVFASINRDHLLNGQNDNTTPYWQKPAGSSLDTINRNLAWQEEQRQTLISVFGQSIVNDPTFADLFKPLDKTLPFLSSDKQVALYDLEQRNNPRILLAGGGTRESIGDFRRSLKQEQEAIQQLLTPDEYFEYQVRESPAARMMRRNAGDFDYTEQEFRDIYKMRADEFTDLDSEAPASPQDYRQRNTNLQDKLKSYLGDDRYQEYARSQDYAWRALKSIGERYGNSNSEMIAVYNETRSARDQIMALRANGALDPNDLKSEAEKIQRDALRHITEIAGQQTADSVEKNIVRLGLDPRSRRLRSF